MVMGNCSKREKVRNNKTRLVLDCAASAELQKVRGTCSTSVWVRIRDDL